MAFCGLSAVGSPPAGAQGRAVSASQFRWSGGLGGNTQEFRITGALGVAVVWTTARVYRMGLGMDWLPLRSGITQEGVGRTANAVLFGLETRRFWDLGSSELGVGLRVGAAGKFYSEAATDTVDGWGFLLLPGVYWDFPLHEDVSLGVEALAGPSFGDTRGLWVLLKACLSFEW